VCAMYVVIGEMKNIQACETQDTTKRFSIKKKEENGSSGKCIVI
jgi:hypothetical protein